jgi:hypothetical protein
MWDFYFNIIFLKPVNYVRADPTTKKLNWCDPSTNIWNVHLIWFWSLVSILVWFRLVWFRFVRFRFVSIGFVRFSLYRYPFTMIQLLKIVIDFKSSWLHKARAAGILFFVLRLWHGLLIFIHDILFFLSESVQEIHQ